MRGVDVDFFVESTGLFTVFFSSEAELDTNGVSEEGFGQSETEERRILCG